LFTSASARLCDDPAFLFLIRLLLCATALKHTVSSNDRIHQPIAWRQPRPEKDLRLEFTQAIEPTLIRVRVVRNELELTQARPATLSSDARTVLLASRHSKTAATTSNERCFEDAHLHVGKYQVPREGT